MYIGSLVYKEIGSLGGDGADTYMYYYHHIDRSNRGWRGREFLQIVVVYMEREGELYLVNGNIGTECRRSTSFWIIQKYSQF
jgi:hypothetical protein